MSLTCVLAHASFSEQRRELLPEIITSWEGGIREVVFDDRRRGSWFTVRAAWHRALELADESGHCLIPQDDMRMARGGFSFIQEVCEANPGEVLSFRWDASNEGWLHKWAVRDDACWARSFHAWSGGCVAVPTPLVRDFLTWAQEFDRLLTRPYRQSDDTRLELALMSWGVETLRCRWSFLRHLGKWSECRRAERDGDDDELALITDTSQLPGLEDPRWVVTEDVPSAVYVPPAFARTVEVLLGDRAGKVGLEHVRDASLSTVR